MEINVGERKRETKMKKEKKKEVGERERELKIKKKNSKEIGDRGGWDKGRN